MHNYKILNYFKICKMGTLAWLAFSSNGCFVNGGSCTPSIDQQVSTHDHISHDSITNSPKLDLQCHRRFIKNINQSDEQKCRSCGLRQHSKGTSILTSIATMSFFVIGGGMIASSLLSAWYMTRTFGFPLGMLSCLGGYMLTIAYCYIGNRTSDIEQRQFEESFE